MIICEPHYDHLRALLANCTFLHFIGGLQLHSIVQKVIVLISECCFSLVNDTLFICETDTHPEKSILYCVVPGAG